MKPVYDVYRKGNAPEVLARKLTGERFRFITKNRMFVGRMGQWIVKPMAAEEKSWNGAGIAGPYDSMKGILEIQGAHLEEDHHFQRDYEYVRSGKDQTEPAVSEG